VVNGDQSDRSFSVARAFANLGFLLPGRPPEHGPPGGWLANWQNASIAWI
jgi:hypothetical protein